MEKWWILICLSIKHKAVTSWTYKTLPVYRWQEAVVTDICQQPQLGQEVLPEEARHKAKSHHLANILRTPHFWAHRKRAKEAVRLLTCYFSWATPPAPICPPTVKCLKLWCCMSWTPASLLRFKHISCLGPFRIQNLGAFLCKVTWEIWSGGCAQITLAHAGGPDFSMRQGSHCTLARKHSKKRKYHFNLFSYLAP